MICQYHLPGAGGQGVSGVDGAILAIILLDQGCGRTPIRFAVCTFDGVEGAGVRHGAFLGGTWQPQLGEDRTFCSHHWCAAPCNADAERGCIPAGVGESPHSQPPSHRCAPRHPTLYRVGSYASPQSTVWGVRAAVQVLCPPQQPNAATNALAFCCLRLRTAALNGWCGWGRGWCGDMLLWQGVDIYMWGRIRRGLRGSPSESRLPPRQQPPW